MKKSFLFIIALTAIMIFPFLVKAQDATIKKIALGLDNWATNNPQEKVYLHLDKPYYAVGDDIWFKAYVTLGPKHIPSTLSGILHVELLNSQDSVFSSLKLNLLNGTAKGDFYLPDTLNAGNYRIRAYTNWMRNAGPSYFFDKTIKVGNAINKKAVFEVKPDVVKRKTKTDNVKPDKTSVQFFPESGSFVNGIWTKMAFKALGADGLGKDITGVIIDNTNQQIATISTQHLGMGIFTIMPEASKTYIARIKFRDGTQADFNLPKAINYGYVLNVSSADSNFISLRITASPLMAGTGTNQINLIAQSNGQICFATNFAVQNSIITAKIPKNRFQSGIGQLTLFNENGKPLNERIVFIDNNDKLKLNIQPLQQTFIAHKKIKLDITTMADNNLVSGNLSAAVIDERKVPVDEETETTILSSLLLSSDIKGYIEKPNYYFTNQSEKTRADLDLLMLTQGYRRFEWKNVINGNMPQLAFGPQRALEIKGVIKTLTGKAIPGAKISLYSKGNGIIALDTVADAYGKFTFDNLAFNDSSKFVIQGRNTKDKKYVQVILDTVKPQVSISNPNYPDVILNNGTDIEAYLQNSKRSYDQDISTGIGRHSTLLKEVTIKSTQVSPLSHISNLNGKGHADQVIKGDVFATGACSNLYNCLQGRLLGVIFSTGQIFIPGGLSLNTTGMVPMAVIIDGIFVDGADLGFIDPQDVESVEVLKSAAYLTLYGSQGAQGILIINMKTGLDGSKGTPYNPWRVSYKPQGYYVARTFYSPQYDDPKTNTSLADLRSTVYWNPEIISDKDGKTSIEYFNAGTGSYRVIVEGIDGNGHIGRKVFRYKVE